MTEQARIEGVYLSTTLDLEKLFSPAFSAHAQTIRLRRPEEIEDPSAISFALCWNPAPQAFAPYPNLKLASSIAAGVDSIINCPSLPPEAYVTRVRDESQGDLMAGFAAWHVIWHHRNMRHHIVHEAKHEWSRQWTRAFLPPGRCTVGVLGYGIMGRAIARAVTAMGFPVVAAVRNEPDTPPPPGVRFEAGEGAIERVAAAAHILINVLPLTPATRGILNAEFFQKMPHGASLIQLGRGEHMIEADFAAALDSGRIASASLDVFAVEPLPPEHPFWADERIFITPHQASDSSSELMAEQVMRAASAIAAGKAPETAVDKAKGY